ncbi:MAG TPA: PHB depolymerase family esterase [Polyangia bacterium]|jgi:poly(hydroxyalkanoate) depolymerase family esterase
MRVSTLGRALLIATLGFILARPAEAASLQMVPSWGASGVPAYISMYVYVPDQKAAKPPILVVSHYCGGSASGVFGQARTGGIVAAADQYGFVMIFPQTTNPASSANCWDVGSKASLTHDGGGDTQAVAQMVKYAITTYNGNPERVYATGDSSGAMMTQALLAVYPDVFKAGASFAGVAAGCWSAGWSAASNWGGTCANGQDIMTAQQWGDLARGMYPGYTGHRPRVQLFHGDADTIIKYANYGEAIKEWTNVLGLAASPTSTMTGLTLGSHQATRQQWKNSCGTVVLDGFTSIGGDHGPSDALFNASYVIPFLGLDKTGEVDPEIAACAPDGGMGGSGGGGGSGGSGGAGGRGGSGGAGGGGTGAGGRGGSGGANNTVGSGGAGGRGGAGGSGATGGSTAGGGSGGTAGATGAGGTAGTTGGGAAGATGAGGAAGTTGSGGAASGTAGTTGSGGSASGAAGTTGSGGADGGLPTQPGGCSCVVGAPGLTPYAFVELGVGVGFGLLVLARRRRRPRR